MPRDLPRITARLDALGLSDLIKRLPIEKEEQYFFSDIKLAKSTQALLYDWLYFHPEIKARTSLSIITLTATLVIKPRYTTEKRGRKKLR